MQRDISTDVLVIGGGTAGFGAAIGAARQGARAHGSRAPRARGVKGGGGENGEGIKAAIIEGDSLHRYDRKEMKARAAEAERQGNKHFSHFGPDNNLFGELETLFRTYSECGQGRIRKYLHNPEEAAPYKQDPGTFTAPGFPPGVMPPNLKDNLTKDEFEALVAFLLAQK